MREKKGPGGRGALRIVLLSAAAVLILLVVAFWGLIQEVIDRGAVDSQMSGMQSAYSKEPSSERDNNTASGDTAINPRFQSLLEQNPDTVGWLQIEGIGYDGAVVQRDDSYYLTHDFYGKGSSYGTVFASQYNDIDPNGEPGGADDNIVLYGHNLILTTAEPDDRTNDRMFNNLLKYKKAEFFEKYPFITFDSLWEDGDWIVVAVFVANTDSGHGEPFLYNTMRRFSGEAEKRSFIDAVMERSLVLTDTDVSVTDRFLTLSTCGYDFADERCVVVARKLRPDETREQLAGREVWLNLDPVMPEIWNEMYG